MINGMFDAGFRMDDVLYDAKIGLWYIEIDQDKPPRMYADQAMLELLGLKELPTPEECYVHWYDRIGKEYLETVEEGVKTMLSDQHAEVNYTWEHPSWGKIYVRCGGTLDKNYTRGYRMRGYHQNISEMLCLKKEKERLKSFSETMLMSLKDLYCSVLLLELEKNEINPLHVTREGEILLKDIRTADEILEGMADFYHPDDQKNMKKEISREAFYSRIAQGEEKFIGEYRRNIDGEYRWVTITCFFMQNHSREHRVLIAIQDIHEQKKKEWEQQSIYRFTVENEYEGIAIVDLKKGIADVKIAEARNFSSIPKKAEIKSTESRFLESFMCKEDQEKYRKEMCMPLILKRLDEGEEVVHFFFKGGMKQEFRHKELTIRYFDEEKRKLFVCVRDIEQQIQTEKKSKEALQEAFEAAKRANEAKSEFLTKMSHDIRTPMNAIVGMTAIAEKNMDDKAKVQDCISKIKIANKHLLHLINEVLDMSRIESGKLSLSLEEFDLLELVDSVAAMIQPRAERKQQDFLVKIEKVRHSKVIGDYLGLQKVFNNILSNAVKYTQNEGKIQMKVEEVWSIHKAYGHYRFTFEDNGYGMSEEFQKKLFLPFERSDDPRVEGIEGTGLGMPIAYNIIQLMHGEIQVKSKLNEGSTFIINLYLQRQKRKEQTAEESQEAQQEIVAFPGYRVLLVEDNELNIEIAKEILKMFELEVQVAQNGEEAVERYREQEPGYFDMVFMDIQMPVMDGYSAARAIRDSRKEDAAVIPIVAMTANAFMEDVQKAIRAGMNDHIAKPIDIELLKSVLRKWLG